jgi:hypothetical protein
VCVIICSDAFVIRASHDDYARDESTSEVIRAHHRSFINLISSMDHEYR